MTFGTFNYQAVEGSSRCLKLGHHVDRVAEHFVKADLEGNFAVHTTQNMAMKASFIFHSASFDSE
jgi:hypothetical protein